MTWNPLWPEEGKGVAFPVTDKQEVWIWGPPTVPEVTRASYDAKGHQFVIKDEKRVSQHQVTHWCARPADQRPNPPKLESRGRPLPRRPARP